MTSKLKVFEKRYKKTKSIKSSSKRRKELFKILTDISASYKYKTKKVSRLKKRIKLSIYQLDLKEKNPRLYKEKIRRLVRLAVTARKNKKRVSDVLKKELQKMGPADRKLFKYASEQGRLYYLLRLYGESYAKSNIKMSRKKIIEIYNSRVSTIYPESGRWLEFENLDNEAIRRSLLNPYYSVKVVSYKLSRDKRYFVVKYSYVITTGVYNVPVQEGTFTLKLLVNKVKNDLDGIR